MLSGTTAPVSHLSGKTVYVVLDRLWPCVLM
jgi:hypothetical protein